MSHARGIPGVGARQRYGGQPLGIYLGREALRDAVLLHSSEAHYSIPKAAHILRMKAQVVPCEPNGQIDLAVLRATLSGIETSSVVVAVTCGTTVKGAHDVYAIIVFGVIGYVLIRLGCEPAPLMLGFVLGPLLEEHLRRVLIIWSPSPSRQGCCWQVLPPSCWQRCLRSDAKRSEVFVEDD